MLAVKTEAGAKYLIDPDPDFLTVTRLSEKPLGNMNLECGFRATLVRDDTLVVGGVVIATCLHCNRQFRSSRIVEVRDDADA